MDPLPGISSTEGFEGGEDERLKRLGQAVTEERRGLNDKMGAAMVSGLHRLEQHERSQQHRQVRLAQRLLEERVQLEVAHEDFLENLREVHALEDERALDLERVGTALDMDDPSRDAQLE